MTNTKKKNIFIHNKGSNNTSDKQSTGVESNDDDEVKLVPNI